MNECLQSLRLAECRGSERKEVVFYMLMRLKSFKSCMEGEGETRREMGREKERERLPYALYNLPYAIYIAKYTYVYECVCSLVRFHSFAGVCQKKSCV